MNRDFKGIWIPKEIWLNTDLTVMEKLFLVEIDSLDNERGCFASNAHFSELFQLSKNRCGEIIKALKKKNYVKITYLREGKQVKSRTVKMVSKLPLKPIREIEHPYSESRVNPIREIEEGYSKNTEGIYPSLIDSKKEREARALDFLKLNYPSRFEVFLQQNKSQIKDFKKFELDFNDTCDQEKLEYNDRVLFGRLGKYARNWIENQNRYQEKEEDNQRPTYLRKIL